MEQNLLVNVESSTIKHAVLRFSVRTKCHKKRQRVTFEWADVSGPGPVSFLSRRFMYYILLTLHNLINLLNVASATVVFEYIIFHLLLRGVQTR